MRIVYVSRSNSGQPHPFIKEQADTISEKYGVEIQHFLIRSGGIKGYTRAVMQLFKWIRKNDIDIIHVHYGLWTLVAVINKFLLLKKYKIVTTFHGSDIFKSGDRQFSVLGSYFSHHNVLVSERMLKYVNKSYSVIPCGIDINVNLDYRESTRRENGWSEEDFVILFSSNFERKVKDPEFAFQVIEAFSRKTNKHVRFIELKGFTRMQVTRLMQAADALLMCSKSEGSPQVIKEAILNALPVVSNDVGDVQSICAGIDNCFIVEKSVEKYVQCLLYLASVNARIQNRSSIIERFDNNVIADKIYHIYNTALQ